MQKFTGAEYIKIATANAYGLDRENWDKRLDWFENNYVNAHKMIDEAKEPVKFAKALKAFKDYLNQEPTGYTMDLDATASGLQIYACLTGCMNTARNTNLLPNFDRMCPYNNTAITMSNLSNKTFNRDDVKKPLMTTFYGSVEQPKSVFGEGTPELKSFYDSLHQEFTGAVDAMNDIQSCWQSDKEVHQWVMPDGHTVYVPVRYNESRIIEVDTLGQLKFTQSIELVGKQTHGISLAANIIHSIDGYVCREMIRKAKELNFRILTVHDAFSASPNYMNKVRNNYRNILADIADSNLLSDILSQICGEEVEYQKFSLDLGDHIREANYALS